MTGTARRPTALLVPPLLLACLALAGCPFQKEVDVFPEPDNVVESAEILRQADFGPIIVTFVSYPLRSGAPPDGVRAAVVRAMGRLPCSAATFYWSERSVAERWIQSQIAARRRNGQPIRLVLAGHGLGGTEAGEATKEILAKVPDAEIVLLLTVDAIKAGRIGAAAGATGAVIAKRIPGVNSSFIGYDSAPVPDGQRFWAHVNYYQDKSQLYHGTAMPGAENHLLEDWTGLLNHGNADDFAFPMLTADIKSALQRSGP